jgi:hypothetical protein
MIKLFALILSLASFSAPSFAEPRNGSIGVAHVVDLYTLQGCHGEDTLVVVTTDEDFDTLSRGALLGEPRRVQILGTDKFVTTSRVRDGHWIQAYDMVTGQPVLIVTQRSSPRPW